MVAQVAPTTFRYSHTIGRQETRGGDGFFLPISLTRGEGDRLYVLSRGTETPAFFPCKRVTICTVDEELLGQFGQKIPPEEADASAPDGSFFWPTSVALDSQGNAFVADEWLNRISVFTKDGEWIRKWGTPGDGDGEINRPSGMVFDKGDNLFMVDSHNHRVQIFDGEGNFISKWGVEGTGDGELSYPWGIDMDQNGDVFIADWRNDRIQKFTADGKFLMKFGSSGNGDGEFNRPTGVAVDREGTIYVTDFKNDRLQVFNPEGEYLTQLTGEATLSKWGLERVVIDPLAMRGREICQNLEEQEKPFTGPIAVAVDDDLRVFVAECTRSRVQVFQKQSANFSGGPL
ncbi:MAG: 6-bladed beta-propeller [SAR202 cluster bacterium]|nr:6-bladed beta-propeller [SAR202 cluster bacterium]HCP23982.1 hypothetical protein [Dehalococcoidia bacterium]|tara:strand:- start:4301 stop:5335 length:1035 start_codon:yes stop_codon:yes gene_type:complete